MMVAQVEEVFLDGGAFLEVAFAPFGNESGDIHGDALSRPALCRTNGPLSTFHRCGDCRWESA